jgi:hypothetical protein
MLSASGGPANGRNHAPNSVGDATNGFVAAPRGCDRRGPRRKKKPVAMDRPGAVVLQAKHEFERGLRPPLRPRARRADPPARCVHREVRHLSVDPLGAVVARPRRGPDRATFHPGYGGYNRYLSIRRQREPEMHLAHAKTHHRFEHMRFRGTARRWHSGRARGGFRQIVFGDVGSKSTEAAEADALVFP